MTDYEEKDYTLIFCRRIGSEGQKEILLGMKKRGFGVGKWNGFGGKLEGTETIDEGAVRELEEESNLKSTTLTRKGYLVFKLLDVAKIMRVHVFETWEFTGEATETEEMRPKWYAESEIPYEKMWPDDKFWLHFLLEGKSFVGRLVSSFSIPQVLIVSQWNLLQVRVRGRGNHHRLFRQGADLVVVAFNLSLELFKSFTHCMFC